MIHIKINNMLKKLIAIICLQALLNDILICANLKKSKFSKRHISEFKNSNNHKIDSFKPYISTEKLSLNQKSLKLKSDCNQFDKDLIECFAYKLFLKNSQKYQDLDLDNVLAKPVLIKHFENKTVEQYQNVTFTCQTQIDALPIFLFYKLNKDIIKKYNSISLNKLLELFSENLQDQKSNNDYTTTNKRIRLERREHAEDSNKDEFSDLETVYLHISNTTTSDTGYYLCIVANSLKSFRVTYAYLKVSSKEESEPSKYDVLSFKDLIESLVAENSILIFMEQHKEISISIILLLLSLCLSLCFCNCKKKDRFLKFKKIDDQINSLIEKNTNSIKNNYIYECMSNHSAHYIPASSDNKLIHVIDCDCGIEKSLFHDYKNELIDANNNENDKIHFKQAKNLYFPQINDFSFLEDLSTLEFPREKLKLGQLIDEGAFGKVYIGQVFDISFEENSSIVAVKTLKENATKNQFINFVRELRMMKNIGKHENIISILGCCTKSGPLYAIFEYAKFGNLRNYLRNQRPKDYIDLVNYTGISDNMDDYYDEEKFNHNDQYNLSNILQLNSYENKIRSLCINSVSKPLSTFGTLKSDNLIEKENIKDDIYLSDTLPQINLIIDLIQFCVQISNGMKFLHTKNISHRDLAARNILLDENKIAKISDFGFARELQQDCSYKTKSENLIPVKWMAPEIFLDRMSVYQNSDIWSFGVLMWEVFTLGDNPYPTVQVEKLFEYLKEGNRMSKPIYADDEIYQLILECWSFKSNLRPSFDIINQRLSLILEKYQIKKNQKLNNSTNKTLFEDKEMNKFKNVEIASEKNSLNLNILSNTFKSKHNNLNSFGINIISEADINSSSSSSIMTIISPHINNTSVKSNDKLNFNHNNTYNRQSESEDSQYFSGADNSLFYGEGSQFSLASSNFTQLSVPFSDEAIKAVSLMTNKISQTPPSPKPLKSLSKLLNIASAAHQL